MTSTNLLLLLLTGLLSWQLLVPEPWFFSLKESTIGEIGQLDTIKVNTETLPTQSAVLETVSEESFDSLVFTGDVMLGRHVETLLDRYGPEYVYSGLTLKSLSRKPAVIGNFEAAAALPHRQTPYFTMRFSVAPQHFVAVGAHFTHVSLANNHSLDYGESGYATVKTFLEEQSVVPFGHNTNLNTHSIAYIESKRGRMALLGINASQRIPADSDIQSVCSEADTNSDFQIVSIHWGNEYELVHSSTQRALAELLVEECADLIIGHHPHVVQDVDVIKGVLVFYSLGNYIFDQYFSSAVQEGLVVQLQLDSLPQIELIPVSSLKQKSVPAPMTDSERIVFLTALAQRSHPSLTRTITSGTIPLVQPVATSTKMAIMSR